MSLPVTGILWRVCMPARATREKNVCNTYTHMNQVAFELYHMYVI